MVHDSKDVTLTYCKKDLSNYLSDQVDLSAQRFSCNHEVHWSEKFLLQFAVTLVAVYKVRVDGTNLCSFNERFSGNRKVIGSLLGTLWSKPNSLHDANKAVNDGLA